MAKNNKFKRYIDSIIKGIGIATAGGGITIGTGTLNLTDVDFITTVLVVIFSVSVNMVVQYFRKIHWADEE